MTIHLISGPRRYGKTIEAIRIASETGAYLIVANMQEAGRVFDVAKQMSIDIKFPITFDEFLRTRMHGSRVRNVVIDNADEILCRVFAGLTIEAATWTTNNPETET